MNEFNGYSEAYAVGSSLERYSWSRFYEHLGRALQLADEENVKKIKEGWPEMWKAHREQAKTIPQFKGRQ